jgi:hypothetical protein
MDRDSPPGSTGGVTPTEELRFIELMIVRLESRFPDLPSGMVRAVVDTACREFDGARIRDFVPVLVEREAVLALRSFPGSTSVGASEACSGRVEAGRHRR